MAAASPSAGVGIGTGPPGESGNLAVRTSTPSSVTRSVCSNPKSVKVQNIFANLLTKLSSERAILRNARPVIRPGLVPVCTDTDHRLDCEAHAGFRLPDGFVLGIMWYIRSAVEKLVDTVSAVCPNNAAIFALRMLFNDIAVVAEQSARLDHLDGLSQALSRGFSYAYRIGVCQCFIANIICLVEIAVEAAMV